ncbi:MAG: hypothetical protein PF487_08875 [Bacteroidales bacterium]|jgi:hypothetical protein|nr:hypothetical protein [Bacteroidales bacterium]
MLEEKAIDELTKGDNSIVAKLSPWHRFKAVLKKILMFIITLKIVLETLKLLSQMMMKWFDMIRKTMLLHLSDTSWRVMLWATFWRLVYGVIGGILLEYYFQISDKVLELIEMVI